MYDDVGVVRDDAGIGMTGYVCYGDDGNDGWVYDDVRMTGMSMSWVCRCQRDDGWRWRVTTGVCMSMGGGVGVAYGCMTAVATDGWVDSMRDGGGGDGAADGDGKQQCKYGNDVSSKCRQHVGGTAEMVQRRRGGVGAEMANNG